MFKPKTTITGRLENSSGERIRTTDLRVMSPTSCHCSTPQWNEHYRPCSTKSQAQAETASGIFCGEIINQVYALQAMTSAELNGYNLDY
jgi:hypothetical protein